MHRRGQEFSMARIRSVLAVALVSVLAGAAAPAVAQASKELKGVLEKVDASAGRIIVRETHGRRHEMPLDVVAETRIVTPSGEVSIGALHPGDHVTVHHEPGPNGETATEIRVTEPAEAR
jgi:Cu/Ag efflux protein CusF